MATIPLPPYSESQVASVAGSLPDSREALLAHAKASMQAFDTGIMVGDEQAAQAAQVNYAAAIWYLNNRTFFGCRGGPDAPGYQVERHCAAEPGKAPRWGQQGEFLVSVGGMRVLVKTRDDTYAGMARFELHAIEGDRPFLTATGYRSALVPIQAGTTPEQAAAAFIGGMLAEEGQVMIEAEYRARAHRLAAVHWVRSEVANLVAGQAIGEEEDGQLTWFL